MPCIIKGNRKATDMTMISVNKHTVTKRHIDAALLAGGTASHAWFDDESDSTKDIAKQATLKLLGKQLKDSK